MGNSSYDYIKELTEKEIPRLNEDLEKKKKQCEDIQSKLSKINLFSVPFVYGSWSVGELVITSASYDVSWDRHKQLLRQYWVGKGSKHRLMSDGTCKILEGLSYIICAIIAFIMIKNGSYKYTRLCKLSFILALLTIQQILIYCISTFYFEFRENLINKQELKAELKKIKSNIKILTNDITTKNNIVEQYKIATIDPNKEFNKVKSKTANSLGDILESTKKEVLPLIENEQLKKTYKDALKRCEILLDMGKSNGAIITEISKIYNIYLNDINALIVKTKPSDVESIYEMLNNFIVYLNRKIKKFKDIENISLESEVNALNNAFKEES